MDLPALEALVLDGIAEHWCPLTSTHNVLGPDEVARSTCLVKHLPVDHRFSTGHE